LGASITYFISLYYDDIRLISLFLEKLERKNRYRTDLVEFRMTENGHEISKDFP